MSPVIIIRPVLLALLLTLTSQLAHAAKGIPWNSLKDSEQTALRKYRGDWSALTPSEQQKLHQGARKYLELTPRQRQAVERKRSQFEKMPPRQRQQLRKEYHKQKKDK